MLAMQNRMNLIRAIMGNTCNGYMYSRKKQHLLDGASPHVTTICCRGTLEPDEVLFLKIVNMLEKYLTFVSVNVEMKHLLSDKYE